MKVGIENVRKIKHGGIAITCKTKEEIQKINTEVVKKMGKEYEAKIPEWKKPKIRIYDVEDEMEDDELLSAIKNQNPEIIKEDSEVEVKINKKTRNSNIIVLESDPTTFRRIMEEKG